MDYLEILWSILETQSDLEKKMVLYSQINHTKLYPN